MRALRSSQFASLDNCISWLLSNQEFNLFLQHTLKNVDQGLFLGSVWYVQPNRGGIPKQFTVPVEYGFTQESSLHKLRFFLRQEPVLASFSDGVAFYSSFPVQDETGFLYKDIPSLQQFVSTYNAVLKRPHKHIRDLF